jgi:hypothetical protein
VDQPSYSFPKVSGPAARIRTARIQSDEPETLLMTAKFRDPLVGDLMSRSICHGYKSIGSPFVPISPEERDKIIKILEREEQDMICTGCGSTKPSRYLQILGMMACCDARNMVPAAGLIHELAALKAGPVPKPNKRQQWIGEQIAAGRGVNRQAIMAAFGVSRSTAAADVAKFMAGRPDVFLSVLVAASAPHKAAA